jgi:hypothetical protein
MLNPEDKDYNTRRPRLIIPEYGRNIQRMVDYALTIKDREERNKVAQAIINVMGQLNPHLRDVPDFKHKLWDHLFIISDFKLDVDSPYPKPKREDIYTKPERLPYPQKRIKFKHYGKLVEELIKKAIEIEDTDERKSLIFTIANLMKKDYLTWNKESVDDEKIFKDLEILSNGKLKVKNEEEVQLEETKAILARNKKSPANNNNRKHYNKNKNKNKNRNRKN